MKIVFGMLLIASTSIVACGGAPTDGEGSATSGAANSQTSATQAEGLKGGEKLSTEFYGGCSVAQYDACQTADGHYHAGCRLVGGQPVCIPQ